MSDDLLTRSEARKLGLATYFDGEFCSKDHLSDKYTSTGRCCECVKETVQEDSFQKKDKAAVLTKAKQERKETNQFVLEILSFLKESADPDSPLAIYLLEEELSLLPKNRKAALRLEEKFYYTGEICYECKTKSKRRSETGGCEFCKVYKELQWRAANKEKVRAYKQNRRSMMLNAEGTFCEEDILRMFKEQNGLCTACGCDLNKSKYHVDHIMPLILGGSNWPHNLQLLCPPCNCSKGGKHPDEWDKIVKRKFRRNK